MIVVVSDPNLDQFAARLESKLPEGTAVRWVPIDDPDALERAVGDADVLVTGQCDARVARAARKLRLLQAPSAGVDRIDTSELPPGTTLANSYHHEDAVAEFVVAAAIELRRGFIAQDRALRVGIWATPMFDPTEPWRHSLASATIGFVGFGHIGMRAWRAFQGFGARGVAVTRSGQVDSDERPGLVRYDRPAR